AELRIAGLAISDRCELRGETRKDPVLGARIGDALQGQIGLEAVTPCCLGTERQITEAHATDLGALGSNHACEDAVAGLEAERRSSPENSARLDVDRGA